MDKTVLIIEDDIEIAEVISTNIQDIGLPTEHAYEGKEGLKKALSGKYNLVVLDIMLPGIDGISVCKKIREQDKQIPILMLTAKADEIDRVLGLELGADDYMTKPFSLRELIARVKALLRRSQLQLEDTNVDPLNSDDQKQIFVLGKITVDCLKHKASLANTKLDLTSKEFELLELFIKNPGRAYSRSDLLNIIWGYNFEGYEHTVNTHINRLRNKIESDPSNPQYLKTVWGIGYRFAEPGEVEL